MDFAANAIAEVIAPPPRAAAASCESCEPGFEEHLRSAAAEQPSPAGTSKPAGEPAHECEGPPDCADAASASGVTPVASPILLQFAPAPQPTAAPAGSVSTAAPQPTPRLAPPGPVDQPSANAAAAQRASAAQPAAASASPHPPAPAAQPTSAPSPHAAAPDDAAPAIPPTLAQTLAQPANPTPQPAAAAATSDATQVAQAVQAAASQLLGAPAPASAPAPAPAGAVARAVGVASPEARSERGDAKASAAAHAALQRPPAKSAPGPVQEAAPTPVRNDAPETAAPAQLPASSTTATAQHAAEAARAAPAAAQVAREIVRRFSGESTRFEVRLDPPELGRVDVRLEVSRDHRVTAVVAADSPQALAELARHARDLEQTLQSAGLELTENGLSFDLRQSRDDTAETEARRTAAPAGGAEEAAEARPALARPVGLERWRGVRVDIMV